MRTRISCRWQYAVCRLNSACDRMTPRPHPGGQSMTWATMPSAAAITGEPSGPPKSTPAWGSRRGRLLAPLYDRYSESTGTSVTEAAGRASHEYRTSPRPSTARPRRTGRSNALWGPHQPGARAPAKRLHEADQRRVRGVGMHHAARADDEAASAGLGDRLAGLRFRALRRPVPERRPLIEPPPHRAGNRGLALGQRRAGAAIVPVPHVGGQGGEALEHQTLP